MSLGAKATLKQAARSLPECGHSVALPSESLTGPAARNHDRCCRPAHVPCSTVAEGLTGELAGSWLREAATERAASGLSWPGARAFAIPRETLSELKWTISPA